MKNISVYILLFLLFFSFSAKGQTLIRGKVLDERSGIPVSGALIKVKSTNNAVQADYDGKFQLSENKPFPITLLISFLGFKTQEIDVYESGEEITISLSENQNVLDEVVVVGYGTAKKSSYTGAVAVIGNKDIGKLQITNISKALQGAIPGLQSVSSAGQPGSDAAIFLRGVGSVNASSTPLYVVDGAPFAGSISAINANDIQSISVLKDATASALYGSRGANGVIIISTKQGVSNQKPTVAFSSSIGFTSRAIKDYKTLTTKEYYELQWEAIRNNQLDQGKSAENAALYASAELVGSLKINPFGSQYPQPVGTDGKIVAGAKPLWNDSWADALSRTGIRQQYDLSVNGGSDNSKYFVSGGYLNEKGFIIGSDFERFNTRANVTSTVNKWLETGFGISASTSKQSAPPQTDSSQGNFANFQRLVADIYPVYERNADGSYVLDANGDKIYDYGNYRPSSAATGNNLLGSSKYNTYDNKQDIVSVRANATITFLEGLKWKNSVNADYNARTNHSYTNPAYGSGISNGGSVSKGSSRAIGYTVNSFLDYTFNVKDRHFINILAGPEVYVYNVSSLSGSRSNFGFLDKEEPAAASLLNSFTGAADNYKLASYLGKIDYDYLHRYYLSASFRRDGSSRFSKDSRWGNFWSVGASWNAKSEDFLAPVKWINNLTVRTSYGAQGNDNLGTYYAYQDLYSIYNSLGQAGLISSRLPTPDLKWETNLNLNFGVDFAAFDNRLVASVDIYERKSKDLLFSRPLAPSQGFGQIDANIGALRNRGIEGQIQVVPLRNKEFRWDVSLNFGHYKNKITELPQKEIIAGTVGQLGSTKKMVVGGSVYDFFIREWAGVNPENGDALWYKNEYTTDANGNKVISGRTTTNVYADADQYFQGSSLPDIYGGITNTFTYKQFELSFLLSYSIGGKVLDLDEVMIAHTGNNQGRTWTKEALIRWTPENRNTNYPRLTTRTTNWNSISSRFLYDATYARLKNLNLTYNLPASVLSHAKLKQVKLRANAENLLTFFGHKGMDPEQAVDGVTFYRYPAQKSFSLGIDITF
ncbi:MAG: SusC/RagA family TonB-linked outer membrane protein [Dysgonomonas sp.]|uniref:SusC/RagA family TonB-linked outer membrane protein n=1 Tax=Dysgonomonas sp. TaxID=1891233 RepID=UPI003A8722C0